jgi:hypothetical protein
MNKYTCNGFKRVEAETMNEAAGIFASRAAKRHYGRSAYCRTCTQGSYSDGGGFAEYNAFIGRTSGLNETSGRNFNFTVYRD